ncbi:unnamed protein product [Camellia sinensis]
MAASHSFMAFVAIILAAVVLPLSAKAYDGIAPILVPYADNICKEVECGKGNCSVALDSPFGFKCECENGWKRTRLDSSLDYSCMPAAPPAPSVIPLNSSLFDPCYWVYCGGGTCTKNKAMTHTCQCNPGYSNLLNITAFPCYSDCALGSDCAKLGIKVSNSTSSSNSNQVMKRQKEKLKEWIFAWCSSMEEWTKGCSTNQERCVWVSCYGVRFNLWSVDTFKRIGAVWGEVVQLHEDSIKNASFCCGKIRIITGNMEFINRTIRLSCNSELYPVRVCECPEALEGPDWSKSGSVESLKQINGDEKYDCCSQIKGDQRAYAEMAKGVEVRDNEVECPDEVAQCNVDKLQRDVLFVDMQHRKDISMAGNDSRVSESKLVGTEGSVKKPNGGTSLMIPTKRNESGEVGVEGAIVTPGFVRSCNGSEMVGPSINLQVVLEGAHLRNISNGPRLEAHNLDLDQVNSAGVQPMLSPTWVLPAVTRGEGVQAAASRGKVVVKSNSNQRRMGGLRGKRGRGRKRIQKTQTSFSNGFQGGAIFRAAATALPTLIHRIVS